MGKNEISVVVEYAYIAFFFKKKCFSVQSVWFNKLSMQINEQRLQQLSTTQSNGCNLSSSVQVN